jgi:RHS repeat-associated protein
VATQTIEVDAATNRLSATGIAYDARGNLVTEPQESWSRQMRYGPGDRLLAAWATGTGAPEDAYAFAYDAAGERVLKYRLGAAGIEEATFFLRDEGGNVLSELLWSPTLEGYGEWYRLSDYVYLGRRPIVEMTASSAEPGVWTTSYTSLVHDHLDSTRAEVSSGTSWTSLDYWPYGELIQGDDAAIQKHLFTSHEREYTGALTDALGGMDYLHARYYSSGLGRFLSVDPRYGSVGENPSWNRYAYTRNNPLRAVDPFGEEVIVVSGQPGDLKNEEHFLINALARAKKSRAAGEGVKWFVYNSRGKGGYSAAMLGKYAALAKRYGVEMQVVSDPSSIVKYVNNKTGGDSRAADPITSFLYFGHATPGDLDIGFVNHSLWNLMTDETLDVGDFKASAFSSNSTANLVGGCRTACKGNLPFERSVVQQMADKVGGSVRGSTSRVFYPGGVVSDAQLVAHENGEILVVPGRGGQ